MNSDIALHTLQSEIDSLLSVKKALQTETFSLLIDSFVSYLDKGSRIMVCGVGKSGLIACKISSTLSSVGCPSYVLHPTEALHGDLGQVVDNDLGVFISNSGSSSEIRLCYSHLKKKLACDVAIVGIVPSYLSDHCDYFLKFDVQEEGCPLNLAPMASTTASLVLGDCIASCLMDQRQFSVQQYALSHPHGSLGKKASLRVQDVMSSLDEIVYVTPEVTIEGAFELIPLKKSGSVCVCDLKGRLVGMMTDADLRRKIMDFPNCLTHPIHTYMTALPHTVLPENSLWSCIQLMKKYKIDELPVVDEIGQLQGLIDIQDALRTLS